MNQMRVAERVCAGAVVLAMAAFAVWRDARVTHAQDAAVQANALFTKQDVMIPARDGVKLHTEIYTPKNISAGEACSETALSAGCGSSSAIAVSHPP